MPKPVYTPSQIVTQLINQSRIGQPYIKFNLDHTRSLTYYDSGMPSAHQKLITAALQSWSAVTGITFTQTSSAANAEIVFTDEYETYAAWCYTETSGTVITRATINIGAWFDPYESPTLDSYWFSTYIHEIGHGLGLNHSGNYNGYANWSDDAKFSNDVRLLTVMSYFDPQFAGYSSNGYTNPNYQASFGFPSSPMIMDILAVQKLYGSNVTYQAGNTTYGHNNNVSGYMGKIFSAWIDGKNLESGIWTKSKNMSMPMTIFDTGGDDMFDFSTVYKSQTIDLNPGTFSSVGSFKNNLIIAYNTIIEHAVGGRGNDTILANRVHNKLYGNDGSDKIYAGSGNDSIYGGAGNDTVHGGSGNDYFHGGLGRDTANFINSSTGVTVNLSITTTQKTGLGFDKIISIESVIGGNKADIIKGNLDNNSLWGNNGNDFLYGSGGTDMIFGGLGNDTLSGGMGNDVLTGSSGRDVFLFTFGNDIIIDFKNNYDTIKILNPYANFGIKTVKELVDKHAKITKDDVILYLDKDHTLTIRDISDPHILYNDIIFA